MAKKAKKRRVTISPDRDIIYPHDDENSIPVVKVFTAGGRVSVTDDEYDFLVAVKGLKTSPKVRR